MLLMWLCTEPTRPALTGESSTSVFAERHKIQSGVHSQVRGRWQKLSQNIQNRILFSFPFCSCPKSQSSLVTSLISDMAKDKKASLFPCSAVLQERTLTSLDVSFLQGCLPNWSSSSLSSSFIFLFFSVPANSRDHALGIFQNTHLFEELQAEVTISTPWATYSLGCI